MNVIKATNGKKTESVGLVMILFQLLMIYKPDLIGLNTERAVNLIISSGVVGTLFHRFWRNKNEIWRKVKTLVSGVISREKNGGDADR
jgi:hypothetical protein